MSKIDKRLTMKRGYMTDVKWELDIVKAEIIILVEDSSYNRSFIWRKSSRYVSVLLISQVHVMPQKNIVYISVLVINKLMVGFSKFNKCVNWNKYLKMNCLILNFIYKKTNNINSSFSNNIFYVWKKYYHKNSFESLCKIVFISFS